MSPPITCWSVTHAVLTPRGIKYPQHKKTVGAFRPLERGVQRVKNGVSSLHPLRGAELRALRQLHVTAAGTAYLFASARGGPLTARTVHHIVAAAGVAAGLPFPVHPHMLRHACGFYLANKGVDTRALQQYLGHRNIQHTVRYTELTPQRFQDFWND